ncbi:MAG: SRPBCC family protein [Acidobacteriaceae bacterium]|nr:SRPBCC family protein [Acidobacteriaceae bacterium]MBV9779811.1 SRPBCC family protein [Acidobacteriaceae bacterium]
MSAQTQPNPWSQRQEPENNNAEQLANALGWFSVGLGLAEIAAPGTIAELIGVRDDDRTRALLRIYGARELTAGIGILARPQSPGWVWSRVAGDLLDLSALGSAFNSSRTNRTKASIAAAAVLGVTALDVYCAKQLSQVSENGEIETRKSVRVKKAMVIGRSPDEVYRFWHDFSNLPSFMKHLESVEVTGDRQSHWKARGPAGRTVEWDAEIVEDQPNSITWRSIPGSDVDNSGSVRFERATGGRGTLVTVELAYAPPAGVAGAAVAKLFRAEPAQQVEDSLRALKQVLETGEIAKSDASIHRGMHPAQPCLKAAAKAATA